ncbi:MAG: DCC1-like thiol-disulfide oxidoreductase family protein [Gemmatimonadota bacterium]|nr:DCC1-like thiol-disulfide oxidoreductase family protein [Gemmatimonadota bacterium]
MPAPTDLLFYDGSCGLCHRTVLFTLRHDLDGSRFRYAPLGGDTFQTAFTPEQQKTLPDSVIIRTADGRTLLRSAAALHIGEQVGGPWRVIARATGLLPRWLLDWGYDRIASVRKQLVAAPKEACPILPPELRGRFLR